MNQLAIHDKVNHNKAQWTYEVETGTITLRYNDIEVFRSKKYQVPKLVKELSQYNFDYIDHWTDKYKNSSMLLL